MSEVAAARVVTPGMRCPSCRASMSLLDFATHTHGGVAVDVCYDCRMIWFDKWESPQLAPQAVIELFRLIHEHRDAPHQPLASRMNCPRCDTKLALSHDRTKQASFSYYRCAHGHGRLTAFVQFLREKRFVRDLTPHEIEALKADVRQIRCSSCGAPVDLNASSACGYCRAPIAVLDAEAARKAMEDYARAQDLARVGTDARTPTATQSDDRFNLDLRRDWPMQNTSEMQDLILDGIALALRVIVDRVL